MKWLKSTTQKTWLSMVGNKQVFIPPCDTPNHDYLQLSDDEYNSLTKRVVIKSLIAAGNILVLEQEPAELKNSVEALQGNNAALVAKNNGLEKRIRELEAQLSAKSEVFADASPDVEAIKAEAQEEIKAEAIKELQEKQDIIDDLTKKLTKLEKKLAKMNAKVEAEAEVEA